MRVPWHPGTSLFALILVLGASGCVGARGAPSSVDAPPCLVDLSHPFDEDTIYWPTSPSRFEKETLFYGQTEKGSGISERAARALALRGIAAVGIDTASIDHGPSKDFMAHRVLSEAGIPAFENVANLNEVPARGAEIIALPMKIGAGSGGPLRIVAVVPASLCRPR